MNRHAKAYNKFLNFSCAINDETKEKLRTIANTHPVLKSHPVMKKLLQNSDSFISISAITHINEAMLDYTVEIAKQSASSGVQTCLKAIMEQNVLTVASISLNTLMTEQFQEYLSRLSNISDTIKNNETGVFC